MMRTKLGSTKSFDTRDHEWLLMLCGITGSLAYGNSLLEEEVALYRYYGSESTVRCKVYKVPETCTVAR
jgi:hypothetical protein